MNQENHRPNNVLLFLALFILSVYIFIRFCQNLDEITKWTTNTIRNVFRYQDQNQSVELKQVVTHEPNHELNHEFQVTNNHENDQEKNQELLLTSF